MPLHTLIMSQLKKFIIAPHKFDVLTSRRWDSKDTPVKCYDDIFSGTLSLMGYER